MTQPVVHLVERRSSLVRLPVADVRFLVEHARHLIDVRPTFRRGLYELKPLALIGWFDGPSRRFAIRPKLPWPTIQMLLRLGAAQCSEPCQPDNDDLLDILALEFAERLREVIRIGLVAGYREADNIAPFLRGKLRLTEQIHTMTDGGYPHQFSITEHCFDLDTPWNRLPNLVAAQLLNCPGLRTTARMGLLNACSALSHLPLDPVAETEVEHSCSDPRLEHYQPLLSLCRLIAHGLSPACLPSRGSGAFLIDLGRAFEQFVAAGLMSALANRTGWSLQSRRAFAIGPTHLKPDMLILRDGESRFVLDAKWKAPHTSPDAADLHQVLAYAAVTGARHVGLVYPGRRFAQRTLSIPGTPIRVSLFRVRVIGTSEECAASFGPFAAALR